MNRTYFVFMGPAIAILCLQTLHQAIWNPDLSGPETFRTYWPAYLAMTICIALALILGRHEQKDEQWPF